MDFLAMFSVLRGALPYLIAGAVSFGVAWWAQGVRVDHAKNATTECEQAHKDYVTEQKRLAVEAGERAEKRREETIKDWSAKYEQLQKDNEIFRRCVAAGKCGGLPDLPGNSAGLKLSPALGTHANATGGLSATTGATAETTGVATDETPLVLRDCAGDVLQLLQLQDDIRKQYKP